jgi:hypothetical protein
MSIPGFTAEGSFIQARRHYSSSRSFEALARVLPQHEHPPLKRPLLTGGHAHSCSTIGGCAQMIWSGACQDEGLSTVCTDAGCWC